MKASLQVQLKNHLLLFATFIGLPFALSVMAAIFFQLATHGELLLVLSNCLMQAIPSCLIAFACAYGFSKLLDKVTFAASLRAHPYLFAIFAGLPFVIFGLGLFYVITHPSPNSNVCADSLAVFSLLAFATLVGLGLSYCTSFLLDSRVSLISHSPIRLYITIFAVAWTPAFLYLTALNLGLYLYDGPPTPLSYYWLFRLLQIILTVWPMSVLQALLAGSICTVPIIIIAETISRSLVRREAP